MQTKDKNKLSRRYERECLMKLLFQMDVQNDYSPESRDRFITQFVEDNEKLSYFHIVYDAFVANKESVDEKIGKSSKNWNVDRISKVDLAILRVAITEMAYIDDVPHNVSINEAIELAKKFGGEESGKFVNGVLGNLFKEEK